MKKIILSAFILLSFQTINAQTSPRGREKQSKSNSIKSSDSLSRPTAKPTPAPDNTQKKPGNQMHATPTTTNSDNKDRGSKPQTPASKRDSTGVE